MEIVGILRVLGRHRVLVALGAVPAVLIALNLVFQVSLTPPGLASRATASGSATARVFLAGRDEPSADLGTQVTDSLGARSVLLADLLATDSTRTSIARAARVPAVAVMSPATGQPPLQLPLGLDATKAALLATEPYSLAVTADGQIPIITMRATGPDSAAAARVVDAASAMLSQLAGGKPGQQGPVLINRLGPAVQRPVITSPRKAIGVVAGLLVFTLWCMAIVLGAGLARRRLEQRQPAGYTAASP